jgi:hypothetical protein
VRDEGLSCKPRTHTAWQRLRLQQQSFRLLAKQLEKPGELVSREGLSIGKIREALGDYSENPASSRPSLAAATGFLADVAAVPAGATRNRG